MEKGCGWYWQQGDQLGAEEELEQEDFEILRSYIIDNLRASKICWQIGYGGWGKTQRSSSEVLIGWSNNHQFLSCERLREEQVWGGASHFWLLAEFEVWSLRFPGGSACHAGVWSLRFSGGICLQCGRPGFNPWVRKIPWRRKWQPTPVFMPRKFHGWRSLVGYRLWGCKESDTTEQLHFHLKSDIHM